MECYGRKSSFSADRCRSAVTNEDDLKMVCAPRTSSFELVLKGAEILERLVLLFAHEGFRFCKLWSRGSDDSEKIYNKKVISERHRHRYEVNSNFIKFFRNILL